MAITPEKRLTQTRTKIKHYLKTQDGSHMAIVAGTGECHSSVSHALKAMHATGEIHIASYEMRVYRNIKTYRLGAGVDAKIVTKDRALAERTIEVLALLAKGDKTRHELVTLLPSWSSSTMTSVIAFMHKEKLMHVVRKVKVNGVNCHAHVYRAGAGNGCVVLPMKKPVRVKPTVQHKPPPPDPLMAALFGR